MVVGEGLLPESSVLRVYRGERLIGSERRELGDREELDAWLRVDMGGMEHGASTEEALVFHVLQGHITGLTRHSTLYEVGYSGGGTGGERLHRVATTRHRMGDFTPRTEPYSFEFERETTPRQPLKRALPGKSYIRKVALKDAAGAVYLRRKVRFHCIDKLQPRQTPPGAAAGDSAHHEGRGKAARQEYPEEDL